MAITLDVPIDPITPEEFTTKLVNGTGMFDHIMSSVLAHLGAEYDKNRITGSEYTKAYIELVTACMSTALSLLLGKDEAYWKAVTAQLQAMLADAQVKELQPAQIALLLEQMEAARAQTLDTRSDGTTPVTGVLGSQKLLYNQQITSYQRDAEVKAAKLFTDAWITMKTIDEGLLPPTNFENTSLDAILADIKTNNDLG
jgi:hypothetical protein